MLYANFEKQEHNLLAFSVTSKKTVTKTMSNVILFWASKEAVLYINQGLVDNYFKLK